MTIVAECISCGTRLDYDPANGVRRRCLCPFHPHANERLHLPTHGHDKTGVEAVRAWHEQDTST